jgi:hypothetical protein
VGVFVVCVFRDSVVPVVVVPVVVLDVVGNDVGDAVGAKLGT